MVVLSRRTGSRVPTTRALSRPEGPVFSTTEVVESVPIKRRETLNRLRALEDAEVFLETVEGKLAEGSGKT
jgi:hypothetical protein